MIVVCHDNHNDVATKIRLYPELFENGGKIIQIHGDSSQDPLTAASKLAVHREEWIEFFDSNSGRVVVSRSSARKQTAQSLYTRVQGEMKLTADPAGTLRGRKRFHRQVRRKRPDDPPGTRRLMK